MSDEEFRFEINWELEKDVFQAAIRDMIKQCTEEHKVISLPIEMIPGNSFFAQIALICSQLNCGECSKCCEIGEGKPIDITPLEYAYLGAKYGPRNFVTNGTDYAIPYPCPFLKSHKCSIYPDRPLVCALFPFQPGGSAGEHRELKVLAVYSHCPESRRIARTVYMNMWRLRRQLERAVGPLPKGI